jgi:hypothetical protein
MDAEKLLSPLLVVQFMRITFRYYHLGRKAILTPFSMDSLFLFYGDKNTHPFHKNTDKI